jgi:hypothetical protein
MMKDEDNERIIDQYNVRFHDIVVLMCNSMCVLFVA